MDVTGEQDVKQSKPGSKKSKVTCFPSYVQVRPINLMCIDRFICDHKSVYIDT
jgi:hypothetical protein